MNSTLTGPPVTRLAATQATTMQAIVQDTYGAPDVLKLRAVDKPVPLDDEVLVQVRAAAVNTADWIALTGRPYAARLAFGFFRPKVRIPGIAMAGRVAAVGKNVTQFKPGDEVFGEVRSAYAEYVCVAADRIGPKPTNLTFQQPLRFLWQPSPPCKGCATKQGSSRGTRFSSMARRAASARSPFRSPKHWERK